MIQNRTLDFYVENPIREKSNEDYITIRKPKLITRGSLPKKIASPKLKRNSYKEVHYLRVTRETTTIYLYHPQPSAHCLQQLLEH